ncbi:methenyltetrahydromethanopterin cyclohydrolase [Vulcanisaeta sp. JCM 14467]
MGLSMNRLAVDIVKDLIDHEREYNVSTLKINGATIVDTGLKVPGGINAGLAVSRITMGGLASVSLVVYDVDGVTVPAMSVFTDHPVEACILSQLAGWRVQVKDFLANGSGPARALAKKPKKMYEVYGYDETSDEAVLVLETDKYPTDEVVDYIAKETGVKKDSIYLVLVSPASMAGSIQVSARIVETGLYKLDTLKFDLRSVMNGFGLSPIAPLHKDPLIMAGRTNDMLLYGGITYFTVDVDNDDLVKDVVNKAPSSSSKDYGKSFTDLVMQYGWDFLYKVDPSIFAPAVITINSIKTGRTYTAGRINKDILKKALGLS